jgi:antitoxin component YwqK of YwqJK toxin-antitoxin module
MRIYKSKIGFITSSIVLVIVFFGCSNMEQDATKKKRDGLVKQYGKGGVLKNEIMYANSKKNGPAKTYYSDGTLRQEITYVNDTKHGIAITYYENGKKYQETMYDSGVIVDVRRKYRENGNLFAEIPYVNGETAKGLKEYLVDGTLKKNYPKIVIKELNQILKKSEFKLLINMSNNAKSVTFYRGQLTDGQVIGRDAGKIFRQSKGRAEITFPVPPGAFLMQKINIIAVVKTRLGNPYIVEKSYNLAIENTTY